jgi:hypothetical protein
LHDTFFSIAFVDQFSKIRPPGADDLAVKCGIFCFYQKPSMMKAFFAVSRETFMARILAPALPI